MFYVNVEDLEEKCRLYRAPVLKDSDDVTLVMTGSSDILKGHRFSETGCVSILR
jgi:hypothetical protein